MTVDRETLRMFILMLIGFALVYMGLYFSPLGFLATPGAWILLTTVAYDYYRTQKKYG